ncbi:hypothetical protein E2C01_078256 [Portunus trituberculatus]|uniref:Uncharacterized protein n=1 Tax=Portunus trituberculatus TaxID=210409 RepID=A0A5B7ITN1_PORTR|nr:hypothetical protein [Portunus trituberculatus]
MHQTREIDYRTLATQHSRHVPGTRHSHARHIKAHSLQDEVSVWQSKDASYLAGSNGRSTRNTPTPVTPQQHAHWKVSKPQDILSPLQLLLSAPQNLGVT